MAQPELFTPAFYADPYPAYRWLHGHDPVHRDPRMGWLITRYADIQSLAQDPRVSRAEVEATRLTNVPKEALKVARPVLDELQHEVRAKDPPAHAPLRRLLSTAFTPRMVERLRPRIERLTDDLLDAVAAEGQMDVIKDLAYPLPATVIMELLGVPLADRDQLKAWTDDRVVFLGSISVVSDPVSVARQAASSVQQLTAYYRALIAQRRKEPRDDLLTAFTATADDEAGMLTDEEIVSNAIFLLSGGHETTMNLIGNGLIALLRHPDQWHRLRADPDLAPAAVEELLRFDSPVQMVPRATTSRLELSGRSIPAGERLTLVIGAANGDPEQFPEPDRLDLGRAPNAHLAFGWDRHFCLGAHLARVQAQVVFRTLVERYPRMELAVETDDLAWHPNPAFRGVESLPVRFG